MDQAPLTANVLAEIRRRIGPSPRRIPPEMRRYLIARPMIWAVVFKDELLEYYRNQRLLLTEGSVGWGAIVQANGILFGPGPSDAPATMIFSTDPAIEADPSLLSNIASNLYALKGGQWPDPEQQRYGDMLADERERAMGIAIPRSLSGDFNIRSTTVIIRRRHLPGRMLIGMRVPILTHPNSNAIMIVPSIMWPESFAESWRINEDDYPPSLWEAGLLNCAEEGVKVYRETLAKFNLGNFYVRCFVDEPTDGYNVTGYKTNIEFEANPARHIICESFGLPFFVARSQADLFMGLAINTYDTSVLVKGA
jgi:hypothetical protein